MSGVEYWFYDPEKKPTLNLPIKSSYLVSFHSVFGFNVCAHTIQARTYKLFKNYNGLFLSYKYYNFLRDFILKLLLLLSMSMHTFYMHWSIIIYFCEIFNFCYSKMGKLRYFNSIIPYIAIEI